MNLLGRHDNVLATRCASSPSMAQRSRRRAGVLRGRSVGERRVLFPLGNEYWLSANYAAYDVATDDEHLFMVRDFASGDVPSTLIIVDNWFEELKAKVGN